MIEVTRRGFVAGAVAALGAGLAAARPGAAQPASAGPPAAQLIEDLVAANRILVDQGVLDGYGHVSARHDRDPGRFLMSRSIAPELVTAADVLEYDLDSEPVAAGGRTSYLERFIHGAIYRVRPDVRAIVHSHSPAVVPFGVTGAPLRPLYHMSAFLSGGVPVWDIRAAAGGDTDMLVRTPALGRALAQTLGARPVVLMRGHGVVVVGTSLPQAVFRSVYTELNARLQSEAMALGAKVIYLDADEAKKSEETNGALVSRSWELWLRKVRDR